MHVEYQPLEVPLPERTGNRSRTSSTGRSRYAGRAAKRTVLRRPEGLRRARRVDRDLVRSIDFGMFAWLVVPLLRALKWVDGYVGNYGWSIIVLTILINLAMFPLRHKSVVSMRRMQEIQPEVKAIQDRYAKLKMTDPGAAEDEHRADELSIASAASTRRAAACRCC